MKVFEPFKLENSRLEMELMDEVRRQQRIVFPADEN